MDFHLWGILVTGRAVSMEDMPETPRRRWRRKRRRRRRTEGAGQGSRVQIRIWGFRFGV